MLRASQRWNSGLSQTSSPFCELSAVMSGGPRFGRLLIRPRENVRPQLRCRHLPASGFDHSHYVMGGHAPGLAPASYRLRLLPTHPGKRRRVAEDLDG